MRLLILGNSGAGKTTLAADIARLTGVPAFALDSIFWEPGGFNNKRRLEAIERDLDAVRDRTEWIIEGVFGDLAGRILDVVSHLVFLDLPWQQCRAGLISRGSESGSHRDPIDAARRFAELVVWSEAYYLRQDARSRQGHSQMFDLFPGGKLRLGRRENAASVLAKLNIKKVLPAQPGIGSF